MGKENRFHTVLSGCLLRFKYCTPRKKKTQGPSSEIFLDKVDKMARRTPPI